MTDHVTHCRKNAEAVSDDEVREVVEELVERIFPGEHVLPVIGRATTFSCRCRKWLL